MTTKRKTVRAFVKSVDEETREVEQIVSVFENVDLGKDRVKAGAFKNSLERWLASGDPVPVIWSHAWDDPFAHIGEVLEAKELMAGDPLLPDELADLGGLYTRYKVDEEPFAEQVFKLLKSRRVREASFAYDILEEKKNSDGTTDLIELDLIEVGPTLKGMNPMTQLLSAKGFRAELAAELAKEGVVLSEEQVDRAVATAERKTSHTFLPKDDDPDRCSICGLTRNTMGHLNLLATDPEGAKAQVTLAGSLEEVLDAHYRAAFDYAVEEGLGLGGLYALWPEGTYPDESRAIYLVEGWDDPPGEGAYFEFRFATDDEGDLTVESAVEVAVEGVVVPKARRKAAAIAARGAKHLDSAHPEKGLNPASAGVLIEALEVELDDLAG